MTTQVADVVTINGQLVQRCTHVDKEHELASHLLDTFHSKLAALNSSNAGVAAEIAKLERAKGQVHRLQLRNGAETYWFCLLMQCGTPSQVSAGTIFVCAHERAGVCLLFVG